MHSARNWLLGIVACIVAVHVIAWAVEYAQSSGVHLVVTTRPARVPANGSATAAFTVRVTGPTGAPRAGDTIELVDEGYGYFDRTRALTDTGGRATFIYTTWQSSPYQPAGPVPVLVTDRSLGQVIEIDKVITAHIVTYDPTTTKGGA